MSDNKVKYGKLPTYSLCLKLLATSFNSPKKNLQVYKYCMAVFDHLRFLENEENKIANKYGNRTDAGDLIIPKANLAEYNADLRELLDTEIDGDMPTLGLTEEDFDDCNCAYSKDKELWLNPGEIATIFS